MAKAPPRQALEVEHGPVKSDSPGIAPLVGPDENRKFTDSGIEVKTVYDEHDVADLDLEERLGEPGEYPFTRGIHPEMYRSRRWTMRQYAGYATAKETNTRYRYLLEHGSTGLSMAFDLPTQLGRDSDDPRCLGEVGRTGVAIDSIDDMRTGFGAQSPRSMMVRFHTQTGGSTLTAQQPENNIVRVALQGFAAVCGGTQSLHTNGFDEALALPTERAARIALRTQQILAHESGAADTVDPFAGSYYVERLTAEIENEARALMAKIEELGGSVDAIEAGFIQREIEESAFAYHRRLLTKQDILVGVNEYAEGGGEVEVDI